MKLGGSKRNRDQARALRRELTLPEIILWRELRQLAVRIRKQVPADPYVLDFYCAKAKLVIEVDGKLTTAATGRNAMHAEMPGWRNVGWQHFGYEPWTCCKTWTR